MNIFVLDLDPSIAAQYHCNTHVVKMILETAQLLCTAHHCSGTDPKIIPYKSAYKNHPCAIWSRESYSNYIWLCNLGLELCKEYTFRFGKVHKTEAVIKWAHQNVPQALPHKGLTNMEQCVADECKMPPDLIVEAYRKYYITKKVGFIVGGKFQYAKWSRREPPEWFIEGVGLPANNFIKTGKL